MVNELILKFDEETFCDWVNGQFSGTFSRLEVNLPKTSGFSWELARQMGVVKTLAGGKGENRPLLVVCAKLREGEVLTERSSRIKQFTFAKQVLDEAMATPAPGVEGILSQGLFVFYDHIGNFRLSLVYGQADGTKLVWSTAKRLSFYVEAEKPNKTFRDRVALDWSSFDKLKEAFSVEKLTKEFYTRLFAWYQRAMESDEVAFPNDLVKDKEPGEVKSEQIIRLITRLMFVWFLKQKHLVPHDLFDPQRLSEILKAFHPDKGESYYRAILQNLFFATLNTEIPERAFAIEGSRQENEEHFGVKIFFRYAAEFTVSEEEVIRLFRSIPFMNGGLFECLDRDNLYYDGFSRRKGKQARVPNALFFDEKGLIPLLSQYNFTVEENSPGDEEVALDPEMLGKVFENLLAAYNPETNTQARKATGSFYTPREIVNYMVDESLIAHLCTKCGEEHAETIRRLFRVGERPEDEQLCAAMDQALVTAKILDPACGSGAFPMGILLRMVELLRILRRVPEEQSVYDLKLELIQNCIYGGDIQCIAVQISKLRFFISLVCEQKPTADAKENYGIHTLPNLETKFVAADSLIGLPKDGKDVLDLCTGEIAGLKDELFEVRKRHFSARSYQEKKELRKEDRALRTKIKKTVKRDAGADRSRLELLKKEREKVAEPKWVAQGPKPKTTEMFAEFSETGGTEQTPFDENAKKRKQLDAEIAREEQKVSLPTTVVDEIADMLASWDPYDQNTSAKFSDPEWMFNVKDGFDVVIGNPPYVQIQKLPEEVKTKLATQEYHCFSKSSDLYCLFYERGLNELCTKGVLAYISSNKFFRAGYGRTLRELLSRENEIRLLIDFGELPVFDAGTDPCILLVNKQKPSSHLQAATIKEEAGIYALTETIAAKGFAIKSEDLSADGWSLDSPVAMRLIEKLISSGKPLDEVVKGKLYYGIKTGYNEAFVIDRETKETLIRKDPKSVELIRPWLRGKDIKRWYADYQDLYIINIPSSSNKEWKWSGKSPAEAEKCFKLQYPSIYRHMLPHKDNLVSREDQGQYWWELRSCAYVNEFDRPKIVFNETSKELHALYDDQALCVNKTGFIVVCEHPKFLLGLMNSRLLDWFYRSTFPSWGDVWNGGRVQFRGDRMAQIPIADSNSAKQTDIETRVNNILTAKKTNSTADTTALEAEIDQLVYKLYDLTEEEIAIVEETTAAAAKPAKAKAVKKTVAKKKSTRKPQPKLPPSLPGWD